MRMRVFSEEWLQKEFGGVIGCSAAGDYYAMDEEAVADCRRRGWTDEQFRSFLKERLTEFAGVAMRMRGTLGRMTSKKRAAIRALAAAEEVRGG